VTTCRGGFRTAPRGCPFSLLRGLPAGCRTSILTSGNGRLFSVQVVLPTFWELPRQTRTLPGGRRSFPLLGPAQSWNLVRGMVLHANAMHHLAV